MPPDAPAKNTEEPARRIIGALSAAALLILLLLLGLSLAEARRQIAAAGAAAEEILSPDPFAGVAPLARAVFVYDVARGKVLYGRNEEVQWPLASLTKLMTALLASEVGPAEITIARADLAPEGDAGLVVGERWRRDDLVDVALVASSNDAAAALARSLPGDATELMNSRARDLGLAQTYFVNGTGLDRGATAAGGYGSARDVTLLFTHILETKPDLLDRTRLPEIALRSNLKEHRFKNTNTELAAFPGLIGSKTGFTDLAGGNLALAFDAGLGHPVVVVVLGSTAEGRFADAALLAAAARERIATETP